MRRMLQSTIPMNESTNLTTAPRFLPLASGIPGQFSETSFTDTNSPDAGLYLYRVRVEE